MFDSGYRWKKFNDFYTALLENSHSELVQGASAEVVDLATAEARPVQLSMKDWVTTEANKRGLDQYEVWAIIQCESGWKTDAININKNGTYDLGIWQWNSIHKNISTDCKLDYKCATNEAFNKRIHDTNWSAWVCANKLGIK